MANPTVNIDFGGKRYTLFSWAMANQCCHSAVYYRWKMGVRDPKQLVTGLGIPERRESLTKEEKEYLQEVGWYSKGQEDHWEMMCDFAGIPITQIDWLKEQLT